ncbi:MAG: pimeloyl-ACP methyl ester carboxylesterase [Bradymonadia bacterium]|jgi:pimeloyl-ACP methyl ester carboxylesterase
MHPKVRRVLRGLLLSLVALYLIYAAAVFGLQRSLVFAGTSREAPPAPTLAQGVVAHDLSGPFGEVEVWILPSTRGGQAENTEQNAGPAIVFTHGNNELIDDWHTRFGAFQERGYTVALVEFPGYGRSIGEPTQETISEVTVRAFDLLTTRADVDSDRVYAIGRSLGGGAAAALSIERPLAGLVLRSSFSSLRPMAHDLLLPGFLLRDPFDNADAVEIFDGPVLIVHGLQDEIIPYWHSDITLDAAGERGTRIDMDCGHNDCPWDEFAEVFHAWAEIDTGFDPT